MGEEQGRIRFFSSDQPVLAAGVYRITATQTLTAGESGAHRKKLDLPSSALPAEMKAEKTFYVGGERFAIGPDLVHAVFPPDGHRGDFASVLPHIVLKRGTLPWERSPAGDDVPPWMALLLFDEEDASNGDFARPEKAVPLKDARAGLAHEPGEKDDEQLVDVIDVRREFLARLLPGAPSWRLLAHVRENEKSGERSALVMAGRLPGAGAGRAPRRHFAHLVSLEGRLTKDGYNLGSGELVRLVSLASWSFFCEASADKGETLTDLLSGLTPGVGVFRRPVPAGLPPGAADFLADGFIPLPHRLRQSQETISWYRGPLLPSAAPASATLAEAWKSLRPKESEAHHADELLRCYEEHGMLDVSYAAAWQLGRLLALRDRPFALALRQWLRGHRRADLEALNREPYLGDWTGAVDALRVLPSETPPSADAAKRLTAWLREKTRLQGVPFEYLAPDQALLPPESLRYFQLDPCWLASLAAGALGAAGSWGTAEDEIVQLLGVRPPAAGLLLRSRLVSGWPDLRIEAFRDLEGKSPLAAAAAPARLSGEVLLCLFDEPFAAVGLSVKPEGFHFGFSARTSGLFKDCGKRSIPVAWRDAQKRLVDLASLANGLREALELPATVRLSAAQWGRRMAEGTPGARFELSGT